MNSVVQHLLRRSLDGAKMYFTAEEVDEFVDPLRQRPSTSTSSAAT
jgi:predicted RNase H-related nuclease YkuK (DUF458 family)